jgi:hypothetical protein
MPRRKEWFGRTKQILGWLGSNQTVEELDRHQVETLFSIGRSQATALMGDVGIRDRQAKVPTTGRTELIAYLDRNGKTMPGIQKELARRDRVAKQLDEGRGEILGRRHEIASRK